MLERGHESTEPDDVVGQIGWKAQRSTVAARDGRRTPRRARRRDRRISWRSTVGRRRRPRALGWLRAGPWAARRRAAGDQLGTSGAAPARPRPRRRRRGRRRAGRGRAAGCSGSDVSVGGYLPVLRSTTTTSAVGVELEPVDVAVQPHLLAVGQVDGRGDRALGGEHGCGRRAALPGDEPGQRVADRLALPRRRPGGAERHLVPDVVDQRHQVVTGSGRRRAALGQPVGEGVDDDAEALRRRADDGRRRPPARGTTAPDS